MQVLACLLATLLGDSQVATAEPQGEAEDAATVVIEVAFSKRLNRVMPAINRVERIREERFRMNRMDDALSSRSIQRFARAETAGARWAGETLIPDLADYSVANLVRAFTRANLARALPEFRGHIRYRIERLKIDDHSVAAISGANSFVRGKIIVHDANGKKIGEKRIRSNLVIRETVQRNYTGAKFAFAETDARDRVGPALAFFVERAMEAVWPEEADRIEGPIIVRLGGPNELSVEGGRILQPIVSGSSIRFRPNN
ncbi:MAG: hypothetical protein ACE5ED_05510 [Rhodothalassiaceae bacterium]